MINMFSLHLLLLVTFFFGLGTILITWILLSKQSSPILHDFPDFVLWTRRRLLSLKTGNIPELDRNCFGKFVIDLTLVEVVDWHHAVHDTSRSINIRPLPVKQRAIVRRVN